MQAILLAAGRGTRLRPLTDTLPKAMLQINGKPMLQIILEQLKSVGVTDVVIIVNYLKEQIMQYFGNGENFGLRIKYVHQPELKGSANAIALAESHITEKRFFVIACDSFFETHLLTRLLQHTSPGVFACAEVVDGRRYGILVTQGKNVTRIIEKPEIPPTNLANFSVYLLPREIFLACKEIQPGVNGEYWLPDAIQRLIDAGVQFEYEVCDHILDIGTLEQLAEANGK